VQGKAHSNLTESDNGQYLTQVDAGHPAEAFHSATMKCSIRSSILTALAVNVLSLTSLQGQSRDYNIKIGDLLIDFTAHAQYAWNDNVTTVPEGAIDRFNPGIIGPREDYFWTYGIDAGLNWQLTDYNTFGATIGIQWVDYQKLNYMDSQRTFFSISPDTQLDFTVLVGPVEAKAYGKVGYSVDGSNAVLVERAPSDGPIVDAEGRPVIQGTSVSFEVDRYASWTSEVGVDFETNLNPLVWTLGVRQFWLIPDDNDGDEYVEELGRNLATDRWEFTRRSEFIVDTMLYYPMAREDGVGIMGRYSKNDYKRDILTDSSGWQVGAVVDRALGEKTALSARVGYDVRSFSRETTLKYTDGTFADTVRGKNWFYGVEVLNLLGETFNHKIGYNRVIGLGRSTNQQVSDTVSYDFLFEGIRSIDVTGGVQWVSSEDSGPAPFAEDYKLLMFTLALEVELIEDLSSKLQFRHVKKNSDNNDRDFTQNLASLSLQYDF
jgi:hypothetical protein